MTKKHIHYLRWLTLYLLLILVIMLLAFNLFGFSSSTSASNPIPTPKSSSTHASASKTTKAASSTQTTSLSVQRIDPIPDVLPLQVDPQGLLNDMQDAINKVKQQILLDPKLQGRHAALVIAYGPATDANEISTAMRVARKVDDILKTPSFGSGVFNGTVYHEPFYFIGNDPNSVKLEIYFYTQ